MVETYVADALKYGEDYTLDHVKTYLSTGQWVLVASLDEQKQFHGAMTLSFINYPNDRVAFVTTTGGKLIVDRDSIKQLKDLVKQMGATKIQAAVRPSMARLLRRTGFYERHMTVETKI